MTSPRWASRTTLFASHFMHRSMLGGRAVPAITVCQEERDHHPTGQGWGPGTFQGAGAAGPPRLAHVSRTQPLGQPVLCTLTPSHVVLL